MLSLRELQLRFGAALAPEAGAATADPALLAVIDGRGALDAADRLAIYAEMYRARLLDVLREDFTRVRSAVGDEAFEGLVGRYLARQPSSHPSVRHVGGRFAEFIAGETDAPPFLADLARLEWARVEVFDAPDADTLRLADLQSIAPQAWPALRFRPIPACRVLTCAWPVHQIWTAAGAETVERPLPAAPVAADIRVWREEWSVSHAAMSPREGQAFRLLQRGEPFASLCAALAEDLDPEAAAREVGSFLLRWIEDGLLARLPGAEDACAAPPGGHR
jgi:hypothetical protein